MTYYALCIAVCLATLFLAGAAGAAASAVLGRVLVRATRGWTAAARAGALFACRILPLVTGAGLAFGLVLPAFLHLEPVTTRERIGLRLALLSALGLLAGAGAVAQALRTWVASARLRREWARRAAPLPIHGVPVFIVPGDGGLVATTGILAPAVFVSSAVVDLLSRSELEAAVAHEVGHVLSADNLKRVLMRAARLPFCGASAAEAAWTAASEIAADETALRLGAPVEELASALIKVARLRCPPTPCAVSSLVPAGMESGLPERIGRMREMLAGARPGVAHARVLRLAALAAMAAVYAGVCTHPAVLRAAHEFIETLV